MKTLKTIIIFGLILPLISTSCLIDKKKTIEIKEGLVGMIGYGSLMSLKSFEQTLGHKYTDAIYQVHLNDYLREWSYFRPINDPKSDPKSGLKYYGFILQNADSIPFEGIINLNISSKEKSKINCILYLITTEDLINFDKREFGYQKVDVTDKIDEYSFKGGKVYVYVHMPDPQVKFDETKYILIKDLMDLITNACDSIGMNFRKEFDCSTMPYAGQILPYQKIIWKQGK
ncbi:MAG: hypothetical protein V1783_04530 [Bacteroidota bacterium]